METTNDQTSIENTPANAPDVGTGEGAPQVEATDPVENPSEEPLPAVDGDDAPSPEPEADGGGDDVGVPGKDPNEGDSPLSANLQSLRERLWPLNVGLSYERAVDKNGVDHWNVTASWSSGYEQTSTYSERIEENATETEVDALYNRIRLAVTESV